MLLVNTFAKYELYFECRFKFVRKFPDVYVSSKSVIRRLHNKFCATGSILDKKANNRREKLRLY